MHVKVKAWQASQELLPLYSRNWREGMVEDAALRRRRKCHRLSVEFRIHNGSAKSALLRGEWRVDDGGVRELLMSVGVPVTPPAVVDPTQFILKTVLVNVASDEDGIPREICGFSPKESGE